MSELPRNWVSGPDVDMREDFVRSWKQLGERVREGRTGSDTKYRKE